MVRDAEKRKRKYEAKVDPDVLKAQTTALKPSMIKHQSIYMGVVTDLEERIKKLVEAEGVTTLQVRDYLNYGRELLDLSRRFSKTTLLAEAQTKAQKWSDRGLDPSLLQSVAEFFGLSLDPTIADVEHSLFYYRRPTKEHTSCILAPSYTNVSGMIQNIYAIPFIVGRKATYGLISLYVAAAIALGKARLGIYKDNGKSYPSKLMLDAGEVDTDTTGIKSLIIDLTLKPNLYFLSVLLKLGQQFRAFSNLYALSILGADTVVGSPNLMYRAYIGDYVPLLDPYPQGAFAVLTSPFALFLSTVS